MSGVRGLKGIDRPFLGRFPFWIRTRCAIAIGVNAGLVGVLLTGYRVTGERHHGHRHGAPRPGDPSGPLDAEAQRGRADGNSGSRGNRRRDSSRDDREMTQPGRADTRRGPRSNRDRQSDAIRTRLHPEFEVDVRHVWHPLPDGLTVEPTDMSLTLFNGRR